MQKISACGGINPRSAERWGGCIKGTSGKQKWRVVIDFRKINEHSPQDNHPIPNVEEILERFGGAHYFSAFDLASGFYQIMLEGDSKEKTAFSTPDGHFQFRRMPMGLKNAPATFQRAMNYVLRGLIEVICFVYLDDIIIYGRTLEEHFKNLSLLLQRLKEHGMKLQSDKCESSTRIRIFGSYYYK